MTPDAVSGATRDTTERLAQEVAARRRLDERTRAPVEVYDPAELVGVVVVTFGDGEHIAHLLRRLAAEAASIVVVDLDSKDDTVVKARAALPGLEPVVIPTAAGFGAAINAGVRLLEEPFVLVVHGDARPRPGAVDALLATVAPNGRHVGCAGVRVISPGGELEPSAGFRPTLRAKIGARLLRAWPRYAAYYVHKPSAFVPRERLDVGWVSDVTMLLSREAFDDVGGFDEGFFLAYLGRDFGLRLGAAGWRVVHEIRATAIHFDIVVEARASVRRARRRFAAAHGARRHLLRSKTG